MALRYLSFKSNLQPKVYIFQNDKKANDDNKKNHLLYVIDL